MKQSCPDCKTIIEIDENEYPENCRLEKECPLCGSVVTFLIPKREPKVVVKEVPVEVGKEKIEAQNARIAELEAEMMRLREQQAVSVVSQPTTNVPPPSVVKNDIPRYVQTARQADVEPKLGWNWGAFLLSGLWGLFNGSAWAFFVLLLLSWIPVAGAIIDLIVCIILGVNGSKWAWEKKSWENAEHFNQVQHKWAVAGAIVFVLSLVIGVIVALVSIGI